MLFNLLKTDEKDSLKKMQSKISRLNEFISTFDEYIMKFRKFFGCKLWVCHHKTTKQKPAFCIKIMKIAYLW